MAGGARVAQDNRSAVMSGIMRGLEQSLDVAANGTKIDAQNAIRYGSKSGKTYRRAAITRKYKTGGRRARQLAAMGLHGTVDEQSGKTAFTLSYQYHRASKSGEAPADDTGKLAGSIRVLRMGRYRRIVKVYAPYGAVLELRRDRPFLLPAFNKRVEELRLNLRRARRV